MARISLSELVPDVKVSADDYDYLIVQTPWPGHLVGHARLIVRYHDAIPIFESHTIQGKVRHQRQHFKGLMDNYRDKGLFACVSETTRKSLLKLLPSAEASTFVVPNSISAQFHEETPDLTRAIEIIQTRQSSASFLPKGQSLNVDEFQQNFARATGYLLIVSSFEPRKNHRLIVAAWEVLRERHPGLKLVLVGSTQWDHEPLMQGLSYWVQRGEVAIVSNLPVEQLRKLYTSASCVVCPSIAEGFDYSGVEAMACGAVVAASDIEVHHETFGNDVAYFNPYSADQAVDAIESLIAEDQLPRRREFRRSGLANAAKYTRTSVAERWAVFFEDLERKRNA